MNFIVKILLLRLVLFLFFDKYSQYFVIILLYVLSYTNFLNIRCTKYFIIFLLIK